MFKIIGVIVVLLLAALGAYVLFSDSSSTDVKIDAGKQDGGVGVNINIAKDNESGGEVDKTFIVSGENFKFLVDSEENPDLIVNEGDLVRIEFISDSGFHDFVIDEIEGAKTAQLGEGDSQVIEFVADKKGSFEYYCSVGKHRENGMVGNFIVE